MIYDPACADMASLPPPHVSVLMEKLLDFTINITIIIFRPAFEPSMTNTKTTTNKIGVKH